MKALFVRPDENVRVGAHRGRDVEEGRLDPGLAVRGAGLDHKQLWATLSFHAKIRSMVKNHQFCKLKLWRYFYMT